jgi:esterase/lipase superfamily enzyme
MKKEAHHWFSPSLQKDMPIAVYGHYGAAVLMIPTAAADYLEYERFQLMEQIRPLVEAGRFKIFSVNSINTESWMHPTMEGAHKAIRHNQFNRYVTEEVVPFIRTHTSPETPIILTGASFGALHSMNLFLRRPDLFNGVIAMSGVYDLTEYSKGYFDEQVYFNSPIHYIPNLTDHVVLENMRQGKLILATGQGNHEDPEGNRRFSGVLTAKSIPHELALWGHDVHHDWPTWRQMLPYYLDNRF